jgi:flagellar hook-length control protein FliK
MKVTGNPEATATKKAIPDTTQAKPRTRFQDVLKEEKQLAAMSAPALTPRPPFYDVASVDTAHGVPQSDALLASLVQEITVEAPPGSGASVDIQFDSRTLKGLHVRVQKTGDSVDIQFSTSSEAVSRLLTANVQGLAEALVQRGYVAPTLSVHQAQGSTAFTASDSRRSDRGDGERGRQDQGGSQKRR